ncbi:hypothetical protein J7K55_04725 [Candidatus Aerophobetes bacterium]|nr:hypothetical protein [Candidatus Aerophobetes bacterium]
MELEAKYGMTFEEFKEDWNAEKIADKYSHRVERDYNEFSSGKSGKAYLLEGAVFREYIQEI